MTRAGLAAALAGVLALVAGLWLRWIAFDLVGVGLIGVVALGIAVVVRPSALVIERAIQPARVPKGSPAVAVLTVANRGRRRIGSTTATQPFGDTAVYTALPRLRRGEQGLRSYRLPTRQRGIVDVGPVEVTRRDPFALFRTSHRFGGTDRIWVYPRVLPLRPLPTGRARNLEGPSSESSPQGTITFHRLRDYADGDDLRLVHWRSSARVGHLVVKHNVDTSQPYGVVLFDLRPARYTAEGFEEAVDVVTSVLMATAGSGAPVELRLTDGTSLGGTRSRDLTPLVDHLTAVSPDETGSLERSLAALRRAHGTSLVVVTGALDPADLPAVAALRRRFDRLVVVCLDESAAGPQSFPGVRVITAADADGVAAAWNVQASA
ncbi:DUF58 domain-containing protein [Jatrophihabitans sp.]|uniref:DUF58 domain-containing protein n=1 Tax=Jatrophihabitans sp. TaxID=1932789 RepID=UPI0030C6D8FE|nr:hypothetical protein [Jatrophihabitans sp.]